ncbi:MAG: hypothetical protein DRH97_00400 [Chloroflexi bacterium]|nr:MAG: hypothetical protein DRH97_00400 [Chloroflexota bacterium]
MLKKRGFKLLSEFEIEIEAIIFIVAVALVIVAIVYVKYRLEKKSYRKHRLNRCILEFDDEW